MFLDFNNKSPLSYAIERSDTESFRFLIEMLIEHQNSFFSAYLLDDWVL